MSYHSRQFCVDRLNAEIESRKHLICIFRIEDVLVRLLSTPCSTKMMDAVQPRACKEREKHCSPTNSTISCGVSYNDR